jgi:hypothetical protein
MTVPSPIVPETFNVLLNPLHPVGGLAISRRESRLRPWQQQVQQAAVLLLPCILLLRA